VGHIKEPKPTKEQLLQQLDDDSIEEGWFQTERYWEEHDEIVNHDFYVECAKKGIKVPPKKRSDEW